MPRDIVYFEKSTFGNKKSGKTGFEMPTLGEKFPTLGKKGHTNSHFGTISPILGRKETNDEKQKLQGKNRKEDADKEQDRV